MPEAVPYLNMVQIYKLYTAHEELLREVGGAVDGEDDDDSSDESNRGTPNTQARGE